METKRYAGSDIEGSECSEPSPAALRYEMTPFFGCPDPCRPLPVGDSAMGRPLGVPEEGWKAAALPFSILKAAELALAPPIGTGWLCCCPAGPCPVPFAPPAPMIHKDMINAFLSNVGLKVLPAPELLSIRSRHMLWCHFCEAIDALW